uniref:Uncharacterized protein n=1 Tax=Ditylenchus dipsaci TaxID=166011 RepID=A0A915DG57_9BILA
MSSDPLTTNNNNKASFGGRKTVSGIRNILGSSPAQTQPLAGPSAEAASSSSLLGEAAEGMSSSSGKTDSESSMPFGGLFGGSNVCFKTCESWRDVLNYEICMVILTMITVICALLMTATVLYYMYSRNQKQKRDDEGSNCTRSCAYTATTPPLYSGPINRGTRGNQQVDHCNVSPTSNSQMVSSVQKFGADSHE